MKQVIILLFLVTLTLSCDELQNEEGTCVEVSTVSELCGMAVLKIENPMYYHLGETWKEHHNVFFTYYSCKDMAKVKGETFFVEIIDDFEQGDCAVCLAMIDYQGEKRYDLKIVDNCSQEN